MHKSLDDFVCCFQTTISKREITSLLGFGFIDNRENVVFIGSPGRQDTPDDWLFPATITCQKPILQSITTTTFQSLGIELPTEDTIFSPYPFTDDVME